MQQKTITYNATKTAREFHADNSPVRLLIGPVGCGKTVTDCIEVTRRINEQERGSDGIRRSKWAITRNTYPELKSTTIATWETWYPASIFSPIKWDSPIYHHLKFGDIDAMVLFISLDTQADIKKLMSLELTGIYINEMQFIPKSIFDICQQRINRYPPAVYGADITWTGLIGDTNPPPIDHWIYKLFEEKKPEGFKIFKYDPALLKVSEAPTNGQLYSISLNGSIYINNPTADYRWVQNDPDYWIKLVAGYTDEQIKVYLMGDYGSVSDGKPVHPEYNDALHYSRKEIIANEHIEIGLGWDFGVNACVIVQYMPTGQLIVLDEIYDDEMGLRDFVEYRVIPHLNKYYPFWRKNYLSSHDPAGAYGTMVSAQSCEDILRELGIKSISAADNNEPTARRDALKYFLRRLVGGQPGFLLAPHITRLRKALADGYQYARYKSRNEDMFYDKPLKNMYSHVAEALEYICMRYAQADKKPDVSKKEKPYRIMHGNFMGM